MFSEHNTVRLENNKQKKKEIWRLNIMLLNNQWMTEKKIKKIP